MRTKLIEKEKACQLRREGYSVNKIAKTLDVSKGSVSSWIRGVNITPQQERLLKRNSYSEEAVEKRRQARLESERQKREVIIEQARSEVEDISKRDLWLIGNMLYWAEGGKTQRMVRFSNGDPEMIKLMMRFFTEICKVPKSKIKGHIHIHDHLDVPEAERYWRGISGLPKKQFYKTYRRPKTPSRRTTLPNGVMDMYILDVKLFLKLHGWTKGIYEVANLPKK